MRSRIKVQEISVQRNISECKVKDESQQQAELYAILNTMFKSQVPGIVLINCSTETLVMM